MKVQIVTADNIDIIKESGLPTDQAEELTIGCITWRIKYLNNQVGHVTIWPNNRAAACYGGNSIWGEWDNEMQAILTDDGDICEVFANATMHVANNN